MTKRKVALVLSSGGARGYAHIGAIEALEERGFEITSVAGEGMVVKVRAKKPGTALITVGDAALHGGSFVVSVK